MKTIHRTTRRNVIAINVDSVKRVRDLAGSTWSTWQGDSDVITNLR